MTTKSFPYDNPQYTVHEYNSLQVGGASGTAYVVLGGVPAQTNVFSASATVVKANTSPGGNISIYHISANSGSNTYSNTFVANVAVLANLVGNTITTGAFSVNTGGLSANAGDVFIAVTDAAANAVVALSIEYTVTPTANVTA